MNSTTTTPTAFSMTVTLQNVKHSASLSEETDAFTATVCLDGVPAFVASNHGTGGCNEYDPLRGQSLDKFREQLARFERWVTEKVPAAEKYKGWHPSIEMDSIIGEKLTQHLRVKDYQRLTRTKLVLIEDGQLYTLNLKNKVRPDQLSEEQRTGIASRHPGAVILNFLPGTEGLERYLAMEAA
jgi:hypothetical protein